MPTFIKAGFWKEMCSPCTGYKDWLNLDKLIEANSIPGPQGPQGAIGPQGPQGPPGLNSVEWYGSFYDTTNQTGNAGQVWNNGVSVVSGNQIRIANPGVYNIQFSAQIVKESGNSSSHIHIWLSQNGTNIPHSGSQVNFPSNSVYVVTAWNWFIKTTAANEYVQIKWEINSNVNNGIVIESRLPVGNVPAIPGLIVTVNKVD